MYPDPMKLTSARLCLDCDEVHDEAHCPACGSESFAFLTRWVDPGGLRPAVRRSGPATDFDPDRLEAYRELTAPEPPARGTGRRVLRAVAGMATLGVAGWLWTTSRRAAPPPGGAPREAGDAPDRPR